MPEAAKRVAVLGAGAIGCYYGARLQEIGHTVHYITPSGHEALSRQGLQVTSPQGDMSFTKVHAHAASEELSTTSIDWALVCLKSYALDGLQRLLSPLISPHTRILVIMNGLTLEDKVQAMFPSNSVFGGMAFICSNRLTPSHTVHLDYGQLTIGHVKDSDAELHHASLLWQTEKVPVKMSRCLRASRWEKLCWNYPFNGVSCAMGGITVDHILADPDLRQLSEAVMREVVQLANADLTAEGYHSDLLLHEDNMVDTMFRLTSTMGAYRPSTMIDFVEGKKMEINIFETPIQIAQRLGVRCGVMETVGRMAGAHQRLRDKNMQSVSVVGSTNLGKQTLIV